MNIFNESLTNKKLIWQLAKNDFKTKYAGSYFGIFWAFVQPVVTIMIYVFVFQVGFKAAPTVTGYPYVLQLIAGIIPWFFFAEALLNGTNCMIEYSYLVKKVVFKISILPVVKTFSALFVHIFFIFFAMLIFALNGKFPTVYMLQLPYYTFCCICLAVALSYLTAAIVPFFRDFYQIVNIFVQLGMWMCPIMWDASMIPPNFQWFLKINPVNYIIEGYRNCFMNQTWFFENITQGIYFWAVVAVLFIIGTKAFQKLKLHFADVL